jgi:hypothetical protein
MSNATETTFTKGVLIGRLLCVAGRDSGIDASRPAAGCGRLADRVRRLNITRFRSEC